MNTTIKRLENSEHQPYADFLQTQPHRQFEHTLAWKKILEDNFAFQGYYLIAEKVITKKEAMEKNQDKMICGVLPLFEAKTIFGHCLVSTPYAIYTHLLADSEETKKALLEAAQNLTIAKHAAFLEIRDHYLQTTLPQTAKVYNFSLTLTTPEDLWKKLPRGSIRWGIKKAERSNLSLTIGTAKKDVDTFYSLFLKTRQYRGVPAYPYSYFKDIITAFPVKIYTAYKEKIPIASIFLVYYNAEVRYAFAGADRTHLDNQPYHLLIWQAIQDAIKDGFHTFNFGGSLEETNDGGLFEFKKKWADTIVPIPSHFYLHKIKKLPNPNKNLLSLGTIVWKKLPLPLVKALSPLVIRQFT